MAPVRFPVGNRNEVAYLLASILEHRVDLSSELQKGDSVRLLIERTDAPNRRCAAGQRTAARIMVDGRAIETVRFAGSQSRGPYFDGDGKAMRSGSSVHRSSSVASQAASDSVGIRSLASCAVIRASTMLPAGVHRSLIGDWASSCLPGWKGGYGRVSRFGIATDSSRATDTSTALRQGIRQGASVSMSSTIAYVGATGLATGPHLHFEVLVGGVQRNPMSRFATLVR
jgi:hypothetical protein